MRLSAVRRKVFIEEQRVPEALEWDDADAVSLHVLAVGQDGEPLGTGRLLPDGHIGRMAVIAPWRGRSAYSVAGARSTAGECSTPRLPEAIVEPMLAWSIKYVRVFAPDILAAREEWERLHHRAQRIRDHDAKLPLAERWRRSAKRFDAFLDSRARAGRGVPIWSIAPAGFNIRRFSQSIVINRAQIELMAVCRMSSGRLRRLQQALAENGAERGGLDTAISIDPDTGKPWRSRFDIRAIETEERMLQAAIYVVCAYLTGMRDSAPRMAGSHLFLAASMTQRR